MAAAAQAEQQMQQNIDAVNSDVERVLCRCCTCNQEVEEKLAVLARDENPITGAKKLWRLSLIHI